MQSARRKFFSISEAAQELGVSAETLRRWERRGKIKAGRTPTGNRVFSQEDLEILKNSFSSNLKPQGVTVEKPKEQPKTQAKSDLIQPYTTLTKKKKNLPAYSFSRFNLKILFFVVIFFLSNAISAFTLWRYSPLPDTLSTEYKVVSKKVSDFSNHLLFLATKEYEKLAQDINRAKEKSIEKTSKVAIKAKEAVLAEESSFESNVSAGISLYSPTNLLINSSFEGGLTGYSIIGQSTNTNTKVGNESVRSGTQGLKIEDQSCINCQLGVSQSKVNTVNGRNYILSLYVRVKDLKGSPKLRVGLFGEVSKSDPLYLSQPSNYSFYSQDKYEDHSLSLLRPNEWVRFSSSFGNLPLGKYPIVEIIDYEGGTVYLDDLSLNEEVSEGDLALSSSSAFNFPIEENNIKLGSNTIVADSFGNLYPSSPFSGSIGIDGTRFASLYLTKLTIDSGGNLATSGNINAKDITLTGTFTNSGSGTFDSLTVTGNINSDDGALQTNGVTRIDNSGNLTAGTGSFAGNVTPSLDATYNFGSETVRWLNGYFSGDVVVGDAVFKNDFRLTEGLRGGKHSIDMLNPKGEMIASFDEDGNFWVKGEIRQWKKN